jgi:ABC-type Fe3+-citrate transport system substrate-binding protein
LTNRQPHGIIKSSKRDREVNEMKNATAMNELATKIRKEKKEQDRLFSEKFVEEDIMPKIEKTAAQGYFKVQILKSLNEAVNWNFVKQILLEFGYKVGASMGNNYLTISWGDE